GDIETQTLTVTVNPVDDANDDTATTDEDTAVSGDVSLNDTYAGTVSYALNTGPANGNATVNPDGTFSYTPDADFNGTDSFSYDATDVNGDVETQTVTVTVNPVDDASDDTATTNEDTAISGDVSLNDSYAGAVTYALNTGPANGGATVNPDGTFTYTPAADFNGTDSFTYNATDVNGDVETQTVTVTVNPIDDANDDTTVTDEDTAVNGDVSTNDTYAGAVGYALNTGPSNGNATVNPDGTFTYTPDPDFNGSDSFTYDATDVNGDIETQAVTVTVNAVDDASDDTATTNEDTAVSGDVSTNDTYAGAVGYALNTGAANGNATVNPDGTFSYTPDPDFNGSDSFTYDATDVNGDIETQTVTVTVNPVDDANDDTATTNEDTAVSGDVSTNDTYAGAVGYALNTGPANGNATVNADGTFTYTPDPDFNGSDSFTYDATDVNGDIETQTVTVTVNAVDDANDDTATTNEDTAVIGDVSTNDTYAGAVNYALNSGPANGNATVNPDGTFTYTPDADFNGSDSFTYDATDVNGEVETQTVTVTVNPVDDANDDTATTNEDTPVSGDVSANDTYAGAVGYALNTGAANGSATVNADGTFTYTPDADFNGTDSFTYDATDVNGDIETQTVSITVNAVDDANDDTATTDEDMTISGDVSTNDTYAGAVGYALNTGPSYGNATVNPDGTFTYTPDADFNGTDSFTYDATDVNGDIETQTVTVTVNPVDDANDDTATTNEDTAVSGNVSTNDTYSGAVSYVVNNDASHGTVSDDGNGTFTYTPDPDFNGSDSFTYNATDVNGDIETQTVTITVNPVDDTSDDTATTDEDTAVSGDVSTNDTYAGAAGYALNTGAANGTAVVNP
ncbi:beta strand repeat-containing protein, partial [Novipirellula rosea]|uniref:beta strand repeat-containing protein n=1 Tax=Novipirellula rosea TaxID=1031540 RepID=UPI0031E99765